MQENNMYPTNPATTPSEGVNQIISDNIINPVSPKKFPFVIVLLVIFLSVASITSVYLFIQVRTHSLTNSNPSPTPSPIASADPTSNWQTYQNTKYSYQFKHPNFLAITPFPGTQESPSEATMYKLEPEYGEIYALVSMTPNTSIPTTGLTMGKSISGYSTYYKNHPDGVPSDSTPISIVEILGNNKSVQFIFRNTAELDDQANLILSTFKFIPNEAKSKVQKSSFSGSLQDYLQKNCKPGNPYSLDINQLPVKLNSKYIIPMERPDGIFATCRTTDPDQLTESFVSINSTNNQAIYIYDKFSNELGHGGKPFLGFGGVEIYNQNSDRIGAYFNDGEGPALLGQSSIHLRGVKEFVSQSGETFYINIDSVALPGDNPRLVEYLKPYSVDEGFSLPSVDTSKIDNSSLIKYFFATPKEGSPEYNSLTQMKQILSDISAK